MLKTKFSSVLHRKTHFKTAFTSFFLNHFIHFISNALYFEGTPENAIKTHEHSISNIAVQMCSTENFVYNPQWKTVDILLLLNLLQKREIVCFQIAGGLEDDREGVAIEIF